MNADSAREHYMGTLRPGLKGSTHLVVGQPDPELFPRAPTLRSRPWSAPPARQTTSPKDEDQVVGPERFFYDTNTYTGVHKNGGPTTHDPREMNDSACFDHYVGSLRPHLRGQGIGIGTGLQVERPSPVLMTPAPTLDSTFVPATTLLGCSTSPTSPQTSLSASHCHAGPPPPVAAREDVGPERFFHDTSTYTGVHRHGGPTHVDTRGASHVEAQQRPASRSLSRSASAPHGLGAVPPMPGPGPTGATNSNVRYAGSFVLAGRQRRAGVQQAPESGTGHMWGSGGRLGIPTPSMGCTGVSLGSTCGSADGNRSRRSRPSQRRSGPGHVSTGRTS